MKNTIPIMMMVILISASAATYSQVAGDQSTDPRIVGLKVVENLLSREYLLYNKTKGLHYSEACAAVGALRFASKIGDRELTKKIISRYEQMLDPESKLISNFPHVDHSVMGILPFQIFLEVGDRRFLELGLKFADRQWENPTEDGLTRETRWWIDDMYMVGMLQIQAYRATGEGKYADRAAMQLSAYLKQLQEPEGLFPHGKDSPYHWGRGNGWVAASLAEVLKSLPEDHKLRPEIMAGYKKMMEALRPLQSDNGMWRQVVDYKYAWAESSCTAMFAYAMLLGIENGWLDEAQYGAPVEAAWKALCAHVDRDGNLREICVGTGQSDDLEFYLKRPRTLGDLHGQAPFLWLACERLDER